MVKGKIVVISGPSGVGKTTLYKRLLNELKDGSVFPYPPPTRAPRNAEKEGLTTILSLRKVFKS